MHPQPGRLVVEQVLDRSVVTSARGQGPLRLLTPQNHGTGAWVYQSSLGGGFVGADDLALEVDVRAQATAFLSSQSAGKVYRATKSKLRLDVTVGAGATLVNWPDPLMAFKGSRLVQRQSFELAGDASLLCVDSYTAGRVSSGERWASDHLELHLRISREKTPCFVDAITLSAAHGPLPERFAGVDAISTVVLMGPRFEPAIDTLHASVTQTPLERLPAALVTSSRWPWGLVMRIGAASTASLNEVLKGLLQPLLVPVLGDDPLARKA